MFKPYKAHKTRFEKDLKKKSLNPAEIFKDISVLYVTISVVYITLVMTTIADLVETIERDENPWKQIIWIIMYIILGTSYALIARFSSHSK